MDDAITAVISLFLMNRRMQNCINEFYHIWSEYFSPAPVVISIPAVDLFVIEMSWWHMGIVGDVFRVFVIAAFMSTDQAVVLITDPNLGRRSFKNCGLVIIRVQYRIVVAIIEKMVVIRYVCKRFIVAQREGSVGKSLHLGLVIPEK